MHLHLAILLLGLWQAPSAQVPELESVREEFFVLEASDPQPGQGPVALVVLRETPHKRGPIREREVRFAEGPIHLREVENTQAGRPRAVWRERGATWGRTWMAIWDQGLGALETTHWGPVRETHGVVKFAERPWMPLELLEACRVESIDGETFECLDPLAANVTQIEVSVHDLASLAWNQTMGPLQSIEQGPSAARIVEWHRCDGSLAGRFLFQEERLLGFQWQDGPHWARGISRETHREVQASWFPELSDRTGIMESALERLRRKSL